MRLVWAEEIEKWLQFVRPRAMRLVFTSADKLMGEVERPDITVVSYTMLQKLESTLGNSRK